MKTHWKNAAFGLLAAFTLVVTSFGTAVIAAVPASAASVSIGLGNYAQSYAVTTPIGTMYGVCAEHGAATPKTVGGDWSAPAAYWTGDASTLSWLGAEFGKPGTPTWKEPTGTVMSKTDLDGGIAWVAVHRFQVPGTNGGTTGATQAVTYGRIVTSFITDNPGPWTITKVGPTPASPYSSAGEVYTGTFWVKASNGHDVPGVPLAVSGVTLDATSEWGSSTGGGGTHSWVSSAPAAGGTANISVSVSGGAPTTHSAVLYAPSTSGAQALLAFEATGSSSLSFTVSTAALPPAPNTATGTLTIVKQDASGGSNLSGAVFHVTGPNGYVLNPTVSTPGTLTIHKLHYGSYTITETSPPPGWNLTPTPQTVTVGAATATAPISSPTVTFSDTPPTPTISTTASTTYANPGAVLSDLFTISGLATNPALNGGAADTGPVAWELDGPLARPATGSCAVAAFTAAPKFQTGSTAISGNGTYTAGPTSDVTVAGCYAWSETLPASAYNEAVSSSPSASGEQTTVTPTISTAAHESGPDVGSTLSDTVSIAGLTSSYAGTLEWELIGPLAPLPAGSCGGPGGVVSEGLPKAGVPKFTLAQSGSIHAPVNGANTVTTAPVPLAGCYYFDEELTAYGTVPASAGPSPFSPGEAEYLAPKVTTTAHAGSSTVGATLSDTATVSGVTGLASTLSYTVYGPIPPAAPPEAGAQATCPTTAGVWKRAPKFAIGTLAVTRSGTYTLTAAPAVRVSGCYAWSETLRSTATPPAYAAVVSPLGTVSESTYSAPTLSTKAHESKSTPGATLSDTATVSGVTGLASVISYTLYGPLPLGPAKRCSTTPALWKSAKTFATGTLDVDRSGTYKLSATPEVSVVGCYSWVDSIASIESPPAYKGISTLVGTKGETVLILPGGHGTGTRTSVPGTGGRSEVPGANLIVTGGGVPPSPSRSPIWPVVLFGAAGVLAASALLYERRRRRALR